MQLLLWMAVSILKLVMYRVKLVAVPCGVFKNVSKVGHLRTYLSSKQGIQSFLAGTLRNCSKLSYPSPAY